MVYGDLVVDILAMVTVWVLTARAAWIIAIVWIFNVVWAVGLLRAFYQGQFGARMKRVR